MLKRKSEKVKNAKKELISLTNKPIWAAFICSTGGILFVGVKKNCKCDGYTHMLQMISTLQLVSLINSYLKFYIFRFSLKHFSMTKLLQLGVCR